MDDKSKIELKVGIFVFVGLVILAIFVFSIADLRTFYKGYPIRIIFDFAGGIKPGSPVRVAGLEAGEVKKVNFKQNAEEGKMQIEVIAWLKQNLLIPRDSAVYICTLGLLGEKYIEIVPTSDSNDFLQRDGYLIGKSPLLMQSWLEDAEVITDDLKEVIQRIKAEEGTLGKLLYDESLYVELNDLIQRLKSKEGTLGRLLYDDKIYKELEALVSDIRQHPWKLFKETKGKR